MTTQRQRPHIEPVLLRVEDAGIALGLSERATRRLIEQGELETVRLFNATTGDLRVVPQSLVDYRERLRRAATPAPAPTSLARPRTDVIYLKS